MFGGMDSELGHKNTATPASGSAAAATRSARPRCSAATRSGGSPSSASYFSQEIAARRYAHLWIRAGQPLDDGKRFVFNVFAAGATIAPVTGTDAGGAQQPDMRQGLRWRMGGPLKP